MATNYEILQGNALDVLKGMPSESVQCCVTSPPYFGLRDYSSPPTIWGDDENCSHEWIAQITPAANGLVNNVMQGSTLSETSSTRKPRTSNFCTKCDAWKGAFGLEPTPQLFIKHLVMIFEEVWRVLKKDGTCWLNLGDSYASFRDSKCVPQSLDGEQRGMPSSGASNRGAAAFKGSPIKHKDLIGIPWRAAFALQDAGWWLRQDIIWHKLNPMPESVTDRCTKSHEYIFLLTKSSKYFYDNEAIKTPLQDASIVRLGQDIENQESSDRVPGKTNGKMKAVKFGGNNLCPDTRLQSGNERKPKRDRTLGNRNGLGSSTLDVSRLTGASDAEYANRKNYEHRGTGDQTLTGHSGNFDADGNLIGDGYANKKSVWTVSTQPYKDAHFATFPTKLIEPCILAGSREGDVVLDPFNGSGTTGLVSLRHRREYIGIELNADYIEMSNKRLAEVQVRLFS